MKKNKTDKLIDFRIKDLNKKAIQSCDLIIEKINFTKKLLLDNQVPAFPTDTGYQNMIGLQCLIQTLSILMYAINDKFID